MNYRPICFKTFARSNQTERSVWLAFGLAAAEWAAGFGFGGAACRLKRKIHTYGSEQGNSMKTPAGNLSVATLDETSCWTGMATNLAAVGIAASV